MLKPIVGYGVKGVIWYQGEANTESYGGAVHSILGNYPAFAYRKLLPALISNWRQLWNQDDLPFYFVQLPNTSTHHKPTGQPEKSAWAVLRESQLLTWKTVPHTGMIVTIDLGSGDLHPPNKKPFGERMALVALADSYGQKIDFSGPVYDSMVVEENKIRLKFNDADSGLVAKNGPLKEFAIAGADRKFVWADATVDGDTVVVSSPDIASPVAVRYGWADNPTDCNLYNQEDLPASPFRTDDWAP
jgi:sialate O-acetylesterase